MTEPTDPLGQLKFEEALARLEELVAKMESGKLPLENLIADYENGSRLLAVCRSRLDAMERKIEILTHDDGQTGQWRDFADTAESASADAGPRRAADSGELPF